MQKSQRHDCERSNTTHCFFLGLLIIGLWPDYAQPAFCIDHPSAGMPGQSACLMHCHKKYFTCASLQMKCKFQGPGHHFRCEDGHFAARRVQGSEPP